MSELDPGGGVDGGASGPDASRSREPSGRRPLYGRLLRLRHIVPSAWQRAALGEGSVAVAVLLVLADLASVWTLLVLPVAVALVVKAHDVTAGVLARRPAPAGPERPHP